ncbi:hypothetical protein [Leucothrix pacifica]|uniref:Uncharacterized protein n=1 Tax=Leucothrix pacifica TaxID=1247513 RepID=A0A317CW14_9GAMM|nr:hypothetical protein [Leucothrix pacifica]PWR00711.1 hypothetical protein DKW60_00435 [Leucothrix pacifica]
MLGLHDIIGMCECTEEEIRAVAMHENIPDAIATELAEYLITSEDGVPKIRKIIVEDIRIAKRAGNTEKEMQLNEVLKHFIATHPEYPTTG